MRYFLRNIVIGAIALMGAVSCVVDETQDMDITIGNGGNNATTRLEPACVMESRNVSRAREAGISVRSLVDQITTKQLNSNFLRIDEDQSNNNGLYTFKGQDSDSPLATNWNKAQVLEATIISSPDNTTGIYYRSVSLAPEQTYKVNIVKRTENGEVIVDTTHFYHTRMVGWYPMNCELPRREGVPATGMFEDFSTVCKYEEVNGVKRVAVQFTNLDGEDDLMVSNMAEGQSWHKYNSTNPHRSDIHPTDSSKIYREPFGHNVSDPVYSNFLTYKHYRSAIRITAYAQDSDQNLSMWGRITNVFIRNQPTSCKVWLPTELYTQWGEAYDWGNYANHPIVATSMFDNDSNHPEFAEEAKYPVSMQGSSLENDVYLGSSLIQPNHDVELEIHTDAGVYSTTIKWQYKTPIRDANGNVTGEQTIPIFDAGYIYDVKLSLKTDGTIGTILTQDGTEKFYDLSALHGEDHSDDEENSGNTTVSIYRLSNCYIIDPTKSEYREGDKAKYDGFSFLATIIGNGKAGIISSGAQTLYPTNENISPVAAHLLWESELGLISDIELKFGYVRFKLPDYSKRGNAVIAVYDNDDNVLWSWHIWITEQPKEQSITINQTSNTDHDGHHITFLDRNLGATRASLGNSPTDAEILETYGLYYQWGRKDPSMGPPSYNYGSINLNTAPYYDFASDEKTAAEVTQFAQPTLRNAVENPMYLILPTSQPLSYTFNWLHERYDFLWGYNDITGMTVKTIYDPCPYGYRVPSSELDALFAMGSGSAGTYGYTRTITEGTRPNQVTKNFFFPYTGFKGVDIGLNSMVASWKYVGQKGDYQTSMYCDDADAVNNGGINQYMHRARIYVSSRNEWNETNVGDYSGHLHLDFANRRTAAPVRCVKDEQIGSISATVTATANGNNSVTLTYKAHSYGTVIHSINFKYSTDNGATFNDVPNAAINAVHKEFTQGTVNHTTNASTIEYRIIVENDHGLIFTDEYLFKR